MADGRATRPDAAAEQAGEAAPVEPADSTEPARPSQPPGDADADAADDLDWMPV
jgi:hypothetical protein